MFKYYFLRLFIFIFVMFVVICCIEDVDITKPQKKLFYKEIEKNNNISLASIYYEDNIIKEDSMGYDVYIYPDKKNDEYDILYDDGEKAKNNKKV